MGGHFLDIHPAFAGGHQRHAAPRPIQDEAQIDLLADVSRRIHQDLLDRQPFDGHAEDARRDRLSFGGRLCQLDAARLAASADEHLRLDHDRPADARRDGGRLSRRRRHLALGHRDAELSEDAFGLKFL